jgi:hypothetical protein
MMHDAMMNMMGGMPLSHRENSKDAAMLTCFGPEHSDPRSSLLPLTLHNRMAEFDPNRFFFLEAAFRA